MSMNHRHILTFYWAARLGSFARAAHRLNATQSAVSMRIQELEAQIGAQLFDRTQRTARLTPQGVLLMPFAEEILLATERFREAAAAKEEVVGYIRLGVAEIVALTWLPRFIGLLRRLYPRLQLELEVALSHVIEEKLDSGSLDMAFAACELPQSRFSSSPLESVDFCWMCSPAVSEIPEVITPRSLSELPVIATSREWQFRGSTLSWLTSNDVHFRHLTICNTFRTAADLAVAGLGLAYLPEQLYRGDMVSGRLKRLRSDPQPVALQIYSIRPLGGVPAHRLLENAAETVLAEDDVS
ncbi:LysR family transcriptional regulator [Rhizobium lusitanum]|uniref:HTH-type transcriptional regulator TtuA n=2 Tax=Rhizobium lusitanum TaxID=293958 RepID=A0A6L9UK54_9HYPH|nr:LysR family transcriptional regulator [Rhizobium lusitanum]